MKTLLTILLFLPLCLTQALAQTPPLMNYQGAARSHDGTLLAECDIVIQIRQILVGCNIGENIEDFITYISVRHYLVALVITYV